MCVGGTRGDVTYTSKSKFLLAAMKPSTRHDDENQRKWQSQWQWHRGDDSNNNDNYMNYTMRSLDIRQEVAGIVAQQCRGDDIHRDRPPRHDDDGREDDKVAIPGKMMASASHSSSTTTMTTTMTTSRRAMTHHNDIILSRGLPVGGWLQLRAAVANGADAVYLGLAVSLVRAPAANFDLNPKLIHDDNDYCVDDNCEYDNEYHASVGQGRMTTTTMTSHLASLARAVRYCHNNCARVYVAFA